MVLRHFYLRSKPSRGLAVCAVILAGLILSSTSVRGDINRISIIDLTGDFEDRYHVTYNDNQSIRYLKSRNLSDDVPLILNVGNGYVIQVTPKARSVIRDMGGEDFQSTIFRWIMLLWPVLSLFAVMFVLFKYYRR